MVKGEAIFLPSLYGNVDILDEGFPYYIYKRTLYLCTACASVFKQHGRPAQRERESTVMIRFLKFQT